MPETWTRRPISECLATEFAGEWGDAPRVGGNATVLRSTDIDDEGHVSLGGGARRSIPAKKLRSKRLAPGDILLEASGGGPGKPVGRVALFPGGDADAYLSSNFFRTLRPDARVAHAGFLRWRLQHFYGSSRIWLLQQQTTGIINLKYRDYLGSAVDMPPLPEQRQIAAILDTIDDAIRKTEEIIAKLKQVKQGLLHNLLTQGIDDNGELRDPDRHPEQFRESPLGLIPREWEIELLDVVATRGSGHTPSKSAPSYWNGGIKWVSLADSSKLDRVHIWETDKEISELGIANSSAVIHPAGTVVLSRDAGVGKSAVLGTKMAVSQHFMAWRCGARLSNYFLYYWLQHEKPRFEAIALGSTIKTIGLPYFRRLKLQVPPIHEQDAAVQLLLGSEVRSGCESQTLDKLRLLKAGLMEDLLTGRVRVTNLVEDGAE